MTVEPEADRLTDRQRDALHVLVSAPPRGFTPSEFAVKFWPGKQFARSNGPWGLGPDASGRHGGKMLTRLHRMGLVRLIDHDGYYGAVLTPHGHALATALPPDDKTGPLRPPR